MKKNLNMVVVTLSLLCGFCYLSYARDLIKQYDMSDTVVMFVSHEQINLAWKLIGGLKQHKEVVAFSYWNLKREKYIVVLPFGASETLIGHEFGHILNWKAKGIHKDKDKDKDKVNKEGFICPYDICNHCLDCGEFINGYCTYPTD